VDVGVKRGGSPMHHLVSIYVLQAEVTVTLLSGIPEGRGGQEKELGSGSIDLLDLLRRNAEGTISVELLGTSARGAVCPIWHAYIYICLYICIYTYTHIHIYIHKYI